MKENTKVLYKKILLTHDGSKLASAAVPHAISIAKQYAANITLLRVVDDILLTIPTITPTGPSYISAEVSENITGKEKYAARRFLNRLRKKVLAHGVSDIAAVVKDGVVAEEIITYANRHNFDLIVMSTHGASGIKRALLGSVADEVVRGTKVPVLLIRP
jgi:nucleotide-binding universal stress UspA family protein